MRGFIRDEKYRKKIFLVSVKFLSAILGPEMGASILWTPGKMRPFCRKSHVHKIPRFRGGGGISGFARGGGGECRFYFYGREDFSEKNLGHSEQKINKLFQGANSELNSLYILQGKHPEFRRKWPNLEKNHLNAMAQVFPLLILLGTDPPDPTLESARGRFL